MEMPRFFSSSIQSEVVARWFLRAVTEPANWTAPPYKRSFSVKVVLPASGCEIIAKVRRREICCSIRELYCLLTLLVLQKRFQIILSEFPGGGTTGQASLPVQRRPSRPSGRGG